MSWEDEEYEPTITAAPAEVEVDKTRQELEAKPAVPEKPAAAVPLTLKPKHAAKREQQRHEEEAAAERAAAAARRAASAGLTPEEEQLRADREAAQDALGAASGKRLLATDVQSLLGAVALTEGAHFELLGRLAAQKAHALCDRPKMTQAMSFYAAVLAVACAPEKEGGMSLDQLRGLEKLLGVAINQKLAAEKASKGGNTKKKPAAAPKLHLGSAHDVYEEDELDMMSSFTGGGGAAAAAAAAAGGAAGGAEVAEAPFKRNQFAAESDFM